MPGSECTPCSLQGLTTPSSHSNHLFPDTYIVGISEEDNDFPPTPSPPTRPPSFSGNTRDFTRPPHVEFISNLTVNPPLYEEEDKT